LKVIPAALAGVASGAIMIMVWVRYEAGNGQYHAWGATLVALVMAWAIALVGGRKRGPKLQLLAIGLAAAAMAMGQYLVIRTLIAKAMRDTHGQAQYGWWQAASQLWSSRDALFFIIGLAFAGFVPHRRPAAPQREGLK
jgi:hypothetical protein